MSGQEAKQASWRFATLLVYFGFALTGVATTLLGTSLPALTQRLHLSDLQAGYLFAAQFLSSTFGVILSTRLSAASGFRRTLVAGFSLIAAGIAALGFVTWPACLLAVSCYGIGLGIAIPACNLQVAAANPERRAGALNLLNFIWTSGALAWAPFGARVAMKPLSFVLLGAFVAAFTAVIGIATLPADKPVEPRERSAQPQNRSIPLLVCLLTAPMFFLYIGIENVWAGWATSYAQRLNPSDQTWTYAPAFFWAALLAGRALAPVILKRVSEQQLLLLDLSAAVLAGCVFLAARSLAVLFPALAVMGFALSSIYPNLIARMTRDLEGNTGAAGYMFASASAGGAVLPWAVGAFSNHFGSIRMAFLLPVAGSLVMLAIQVYRLRRSATAIGEFASNAGD